MDFTLRPMLLMVWNIQVASVIGVIDRFDVILEPGHLSPRYSYNSQPPPGQFLGHEMQPHH